MAIRDSMAEKAAPFVPPGESVRTVFGGQTHSNYLIIPFILVFLVGIVIFFFINEYRVIVVTEQRILVCRSGRFTTTPVKEVIRELPRGTPIGPATGLWYRTESLGERLYFHKRWHKDIAAADAGV